MKIKEAIRLGRVAIIILCALTLSMCDLALNTSPPDYLKRFTVYKEGDGLIIYFVLADRSGQMTTADGKVSILIMATHFQNPDELKLFDVEFDVKKENFVKTKIGIGAFQQEVLLFPIGRVSFESFRYNVDSLKEGNWKGKVKFGFAGGGRSFRGEDTFYF